MIDKNDQDWIQSYNLLNQEKLLWEKMYTKEKKEKSFLQNKLEFIQTINRIIFTLACLVLGISLSIYTLIHNK